MNVLVLQHIDCEPPGLIEELLREKKVSIQFARSYLGEKYPDDFSSYSGLIVMGGPMGVYEEKKYPFLKEEKKLLEKALKEEKPVLGICLGSQLLASVLGAEVKKGKQKEIGWHDLFLKEEAKKDPLFRQSPALFTALHWHGDIFSLPPGAFSLARSALTEQQAFRYGKNAYGLLFHLEVTAAMLPVWVDRFAAECQEAGVDGREILSQIKQHLTPLHQIGRDVFSNWINLL